MKIALVAAVATGLAGSAMAANILPGSGATVVGSSAYSSAQYGTLDQAVAAGNLINGTSNPTLVGGTTPDPDPRWLFADGTGDNTLIVDLASAASVDYVEFAYNGQDRIPTSFSVLTSTDGVTFTPIAGPSSVSYGSPGIYTLAYTFAPVYAKYVEYDFGSNSIGGFGGGGGAGQGPGIYSLDIEAVPEPSAWALMLVGFAGLGAALRRRRESLASAI